MSAIGFTPGAILHRGWETDSTRGYRIKLITKVAV